jgi:Putative Zn-dependent protease, contains TPR repeats
MKAIQGKLIAACAAFICIQQLSAQTSAVPSEPQQQETPAPVQQQTQVPVEAPVKKQTAVTPVKRDALFLYQNGDYAGAIAICEAELASDPTRVESYVVMCWSLLKNKQYAEAEQHATDGLQVSPFDLRLLEILGEAKYYLGKNNGALEQFQKYVASAPESAARVGAAYYFMGEIYVRQARYQYADIALSAAVKKEPLLDRWWTRLGYAREMAGNYYEAAAAYDEALRLNSASADAQSGKNRVSAKLQ